MRMTNHISRKSMNVKRGTAYKMWECENCGATLDDLIWVADFDGYDGDIGAHHIWKENPRYGYGMMKGYCPCCENDKFEETEKRGGN